MASQLAHATFPDCQCIDNYIPALGYVKLGSYDLIQVLTLHTGATLTSLEGCTHLASLASLRFLLGVFESAINP